MILHCKGTENGSDDDAMVIHEHGIPNTPIQKCMFACFYELLGVVSSFVCFVTEINIINADYFINALIHISSQIESNRVSKSSLKSLVLRKFHQGDHEIETINQLIDECGVIVTNDRCELAYNILKCLNEGAEKRSIDKKELWFD